MWQELYIYHTGAGGIIEISNKVQAIAGFNLLEPLSLIGFAWQI